MMVVLSKLFMHYSTMDCKEFITKIVTELTGVEPDVKITEDTHGAVIVVAVSGNIPKLIGKHGITIDAVRTLAKAIGVNDKYRIKVTLDEPLDQKET